MNKTPPTVLLFALLICGGCETQHYSKDGAEFRVCIICAEGKVILEEETKGTEKGVKN